MKDFVWVVEIKMAGGWSAFASVGVHPTRALARFTAQLERSMGSIARVRKYVRAKS